MITGLLSYFAPFLQEMMEIKRNSGFALKYMEAHITDFDVFCREYFPHKRLLDKELAESWIYKTESKSIRELDRRMRTMRHLSNHLASVGIDSYFCPIQIKISKSPAPHIFTDEQLAEFFCVCDSFKSTTFPLYRHILLPTMFRVIYCCGLRNSEACNLKHSDVNLSKGAMKIIGSKGHKDRIVYLAPDLMELCRKYDAAMGTLLPGREYFFPKPETKTFRQHLYLQAV